MNRLIINEDYIIDRKTNLYYNKDDVEEYKEFFDQIDVDGNGHIVQEEYIRFQRGRLGEQFDYQKCAKEWINNIQKADLDNDGKMTFNEFIITVIISGAIQPIQLY